MISEFIKTADLNRYAIILLNTNEEDYSKVKILKDRNNVGDIGSTLDYYLSNGYTSVVFNPVKANKGDLIRVNPVITPSESISRNTVWKIAGVSAVIMGMLLWDELRQK